MLFKLFLNSRTRKLIVFYLVDKDYLIQSNLLFQEKFKIRDLFLISNKPEFNIPYTRIKCEFLVLDCEERFIERFIPVTKEIKLRGLRGFIYPSFHWNIFKIVNIQFLKVNYEELIECIKENYIDEIIIETLNLFTPITFGEVEYNEELVLSKLCQIFNISIKRQIYYQLNY